MKKYFTLSQAQKALPRVRRILERLVKLKNAIDLLESIEIRYDDMEYDDYLNDLRVNREFHKFSYEFYSALEELENLGCIVKDLDLGLVDFYSVFEGREILLCWKLGEDKIRYWHEIDDGYSGRKPIYDLDELLKQR